MGEVMDLAITVTELEAGGFQYVVLEIVEVAALSFAYRPLKEGKRVYGTAHAAWFGGLEVVLKLSTKREKAIRESLMRMGLSIPEEKP